MSSSKKATGVQSAVESSFSTEPDDPKRRRLLVTGASVASKLAPGQMMTVEWRGKPVWIVNRTAESLDSLRSDVGKLSDPDSSEEQQPEYATNDVRSIKPELFVVIGLCTHLGCSPTYRPEIAPPDLGSDWTGGFFCPCHGSKFDMAGRVYSGVPAPTNLEVPPYQFLSDDRIKVGVDSGAAA